MRPGPWGRLAKMIAQGQDTEEKLRRAASNATARRGIRWNLKKMIELDLLRLDGEIYSITEKGREEFFPAPRS